MAAEIATTNPFAVDLLTDRERLDLNEREVFADGRRAAIDYGRYDELLFRRAASAVDLEYRRRARIPTVEEVHDSWPQIEKQTYAELYAFEGFREALRRRGVRFEAGYGLSQEQLRALAVLTDPTDSRSSSVKMRSLGLTMSVLQAWMREPVFKAERGRRSTENLDDAVATAKDRLVGNVEKGDQRAIEYLLAMKGVYSPALAANQDAMKVVYAVLEAVQKHVTDKSVLRAILNDVQVAGRAFDLTQRELTE